MKNSGCAPALHPLRSTTAGVMRLIYVPSFGSMHVRTYVLLTVTNGTRLALLQIPYTGTLTHQRPFWEADSLSASQELPRILWNPNVHYRAHQSPPLVVSWARSTQSTPFCPIFKIISILSSHLRLGLPSSLFPSDFPTKTPCAPLLPLLATRLANFIPLHFITRSSSLPYCRTPSAYALSLNVRDQVSHPYKTR